MAACSPLPTAVQGVKTEIISGKSIENLMEGGGYQAYNQLVLDKQYFYATEEWALNEFYPRYWKFLEQNNLLLYSGQSNDCDNFAAWARLYAQKLHNDSPNKGKGGIAFGEFMYKRGNGTNHALNFALVKTKDGTKILFFEPQTGAIVYLSESERASVITWIL